MAFGLVPTIGTPAFSEPLREAERRLSAELHDDADDAGTACAGSGFGVVDLEDVLEGQRLEVQPVGGVVVGRHRLGVAVDHHGLEPGLAQRGRGVHAAVVELDALTDAVRARAEDQHLGLLGLRRHLGLGGGVQLVAAVVVRRLGLELGRAGVDGLVHRMDAEAPAQRADADLAGQFRPQRGDLAVGQPAVLGRAAAAPRRARGRRAARRAARPARRSVRRTTGRHRRPPRPPRPAPRAAARARCRRAGRRSACCSRSSSSSTLTVGVRAGPEPGAARSPATASPCRAPR